jgi:hypothetical protein
MAVDIKFIIDGADRGQPTDAENFSVNVTEDKKINARIISYDNDLTFVGGVYDYLFSKLDQSGFCNLINVEVQYVCAGVWKRLANGYIILSECNFLLDKCQVKTKLYDQSFSTKINNNKGIPFSMLNAVTKNLQPVVPPAFVRGQFYNPNNGVYDTNLIFGYSVFDVFKHLISCMSDNLIDFASNLFYKDFTIDGNFILVTNGEAIRTRGPGEVIVTFEKFYDTLNKKLNLCIIFEQQANGRPLLRIEESSYLTQQGALVNLYDQPDINLSFDKERLYSAVSFGASPMLEAENCTGGSCSFTQTPFRGFREETFGFTGECNTSNILDLATSDIIFDTNVIEDVFRYNSTERKLDTFIVQSFWFASQNQYYAVQFDPYNLGQTVYNGDFRNIKVSENWINGYPNSLYSFLNVAPPAGLASLQAFSNFSGTFPPLEPFFVINDSTFENYLNYNGTGIPFANVIYDTGNNFNGTIYTAPYLGLYSVTSYVILKGFFLVSNTREAAAEIRHYNPEGQLINAYEGPLLIKNNPLPIIGIVVTDILMNQGDYLLVNVKAKFETGSGISPSNQVLIDNAAEDSIQYYTSLFIEGVPFQNLNPDEELQAVNIDDVRAYIYSFERPLRMEEIEDILNNTSRPIKFGNYDDPLRVIEGYINKVDIKSIIKQDASITLKSNRILR